MISQFISIFFGIYLNFFFNFIVQEEKHTHSQINTYIYSGVISYLLFFVRLVKYINKLYCLFVFGAIWPGKFLVDDMEAPWGHFRTIVFIVFNLFIFLFFLLTISKIIFLIFWPTFKKNLFSTSIKKKSGEVELTLRNM